MSKTYLDQADALVQLDKLSQGIATTEKQLSEKGVSYPLRPRESGDVVMDIANFTMHATVVQSLARGFLDKPPAKGAAPGGSAAPAGSLTSRCIAINAAAKAAKQKLIPSADVPADTSRMTLGEISAAVASGKLTVEQGKAIHAARPKPEASKFTKVHRRV